MGTRREKDWRAEALASLNDRGISVGEITFLLRDEESRRALGSYVYFVRAGKHGGPVKIGFSKDPWARGAELQVGCPEPLELLATAPGDRSDEARLHERFAYLRRFGEWFSPGNELLTYAFDLARSGSVKGADYYADRRSRNEAPRPIADEAPLRELIFGELPPEGEPQ